VDDKPFHPSERTLQRKSQSFIGPLVLILAGIVLLLNQLGIWNVDWSYVWRLWPLLLILIGLDILLSRTRVGGLVFLLLAAAIIGAAVLFLPLARMPVGDYEREAYSYPASGLEAATIRLEPGVATLQILPASDSGDLIRLEAKHDRHRGLTSLVQEEELARDVARIYLKSKSSTVAWRPFESAPAQEWQVWLAPEIPLQLEVHTGVGRAGLDLGGLTLTRLDLNVGVGSVDVTLPGDGDYEAFINGGVGSMTVEIPATMEASIRVDEGIGSVTVGRRYRPQGRYYVTEGYKSARDKVKVDIDGGVGSITIR